AELGDAADAHAALRRAPDLGRPDRRRADVRPGARPRPDRRALDDALMSSADTRAHRVRSLFDPPIVRRAVVDALKKLGPMNQARNPVMFVVYAGSLLTSVLWIQAALAGGEAPPRFILAISIWLWFTVLFANFAEAMAEGRGKAQADSLRRTRRDVRAKKLAEAKRDARSVEVPASTLRKGDLFLVE